jgi:hypothetical protein
VITKTDIVMDIAYELGVEAPKMSTGSTEPREIFDLVNDVLGLGLARSLTKPEIARQIVEASGQGWNADCESRGGTVTKHGLLAVAAAVDFFID